MSDLTGAETVEALLSAVSASSRCVAGPHAWATSGMTSRTTRRTTAVKTIKIWYSKALDM